jgi:CheY-like chemotaxis protein/nitrogen-specific signal transduction histidine kinase
MSNRTPPRPSDDFAPNDLFAQIELLERTLARERAARAAAEHASQAKAELLATVSHEIRTPLGAIISMADLLANTQLDETQRRYAETLRQSGQGLLDILNDVLDYSKLSAGRFELDVCPFDFNDMMASVGAALAARADEKGLQSTIAVGDGCAQEFIGDPARIRQILNNLIDNAFKFTETGSVEVRAGFDGDAKDARVRFEVRDTGIGLSEDQKARLFEPYVQGDASVGVKYGGTGLGLSIARKLVELMDGEMACESTVGEGSVFWFQVPLRLAGEGRGTGADEAPAADDAASGPLSGRVLIVEDNDVNQMLIKAYLDSFGLAYEVAVDGQEALTALEAGSFDLVLMDIMMPGMDGIEATKRIRAFFGPVARVPIVALTANAMAGDRERYLAAGMDGYVSKPVGAADLFAALAEHLAGPAPLAAQSA